MQLLSISIYNHNGDRRDVNFEVGKLNIITGESETGKSALLTIVDYCLGRDRPTVPTTKPFRSVAWYATLWQFEDGSRAVLGRRSFVGAKSNSRSMLVTGGPDLSMPDFAELMENLDSANLRVQIGARIGLDDVRLEPNEFSLRGARSVGLGTAVLFCLQEQEEIDAKSILFHRQGDSNIATELKDTFPYFLGAVRPDQAKLRAELREAKRRLRSADAAVATAEREGQDVTLTLRNLLADARAVGLNPDERFIAAGDDAAALRALVLVPGQEPPAGNVDDGLLVRDARRDLELRQGHLREELTRSVTRRDLLLDELSGENEYELSLVAQTERLASLDLVPDHNGGAEACPVCLQKLQHPDPTTSAMRARLVSLQTDLASIDRVRPQRARAVAEVDASIAELGAALARVNAEIDLTFRELGEATPTDTASARAFVRGRIDATLSRIEAVDADELQQLANRRDVLERRVRALEADLNADDIREQTTTRLNVVASYLSRYAKELDIEGAGEPVRLDLGELTIVIDEPDGPLPLANLGSGQNWVGYHIAIHLALHQFFIAQSRPVPRFVMFDQPSKAHFQSDADLSHGEARDPDRERVRALYRLLADFADEHEGRFQTIVVDHANFTDEWFQDAVRYNWRAGAPDAKLIPASWILQERSDRDREQES